MKTLAGLMVVFLVLALVARDFGWRTRVALLGALVVMTIIVVR